MSQIVLSRLEALFFPILRKKLLILIDIIIERDLLNSDNNRSFVHIIRIIFSQPNLKTKQNKSQTKSSLFLSCDLPCVASEKDKEK